MTNPLSEALENASAALSIASQAALSLSFAAPTPAPVATPPAPAPVSTAFPVDITVLKRPGGNLYHYGKLFTFPAGPIHAPYVGLDGTAVPAHYWGSRWYDGKFVVKNKIADLIAAKLIPPHAGLVNLGPMLHAGGYGSDNLPVAIGSGPPMSYLGMPFWMGQTGDNYGIGWQPEWHSAYCAVGGGRLLADIETIARDSLTLPIHVMDDATGLPVDYRTYPHFCTYSDQMNSMIDAAERTGITGDTPALVGLNYDTAHSPSFAFLAFLLTDDTVWLEELQLTVSFQWSKDFPNNAHHLDNLQTRELAWGMMALVNAIVATRYAEAKGLMRPEHLPSSYFMQTMMLPTIAWFTTFFTDASPAGLAKINSVFGAPGTYAPWQFDFLTVCVGVGIWQGIPELQPVFDWLASGLVERLSGKQGWNTDWPTFYYVTKPQATWAATFTELVAEDANYAVGTPAGGFLPPTLQNDYSDYVGQALVACRVGKMIGHAGLAALYPTFASRVSHSGIPLNYRHAIGAA